MQDLLDICTAVVERGRDRSQPVECDTHCLPVVRQELAHVCQCAIETLHRIGDFVGRVRQQRRHASQILVERGQQIAAGVQRRHQQLQIAHRAEDVVSVITEC